MDTNKLQRIEQLYLEALDKAKTIKMEKMMDYDCHGISRDMYYLYGNNSLINELWKKMLRIISLSGTTDEPMCEALEDTLLDIINYSADFYSYIKFKDEQNVEK